MRPAGRGPVRVSDVRRIRTGAPGQVDRLRQLHHADVEVRGCGEREEEEVDPHLDRGNEVDGAGAERGQPRADPDARERESECPDVDGCAEGDAKAVLMALCAPLADGGIGSVTAVDLGQPGVDVEVATDPEAAAADRDAAAQVDTKVALAVNPAEGVQGREAEEVRRSGEAEEPFARADRLADVGVGARGSIGHRLVAADDHVHGRVQIDDAEQADGAVDVEPERVRSDQDPVRHMIRARGVQPDLAVALDRDDVEDVEVDADVELEDEAGVVRAVVVDAGEAARVQREDSAERDVEVELDREGALVDRDRHAARGGDDPDEVDLALDREEEAGVHGVRRAVDRVGRISEGHRARRRAERERGAGSDAQPEAAPEVGARTGGDAARRAVSDLHVRVQRQAVLVDLEAPVEREAADPGERDRCVRRYADQKRVRCELEGERAVDRDQASDDELSVHQQVQARVDRHVTRPDRPGAAVGQDVVLTVCQERDDVHRLRIARIEQIVREHVHFEQELAVELDARDRLGVQRERHAADHARVERRTCSVRPAAVDTEVDRAGERAEVLDVRDDGALHPDEGRRADLHGDRDRPGERDHVSQDDRAGDDRLQVEADGVRARDGTVDVRRRARDHDRRRESGRQDVEELLRDRERLVGERRVERHSDAALEAQDPGDVAERRVVARARRDTDADLQAELRGDPGAVLSREAEIMAARAAGLRVVDDHEPGHASGQPDHVDAAAGGEEEGRVGRADLQQEATVHVRPHGRALRRVGCACIERVRVVERRAADDLEQERQRCEVVGALLAADDEDRVAVRVGLALDEELGAVAVQHLPFGAGDDALDLRVLQRQPVEARVELDLTAIAERECRLRARVRAERGHPARRERDLAERVGRQRAEQRAVLARRYGEDRVAGDAGQ